MKKFLFCGKQLIKFQLTKIGVYYYSALRIVEFLNRFFFTFGRVSLEILPRKLDRLDFNICKNVRFLVN